MVLSWCLGAHLDGRHLLMILFPLLQCCIVALVCCCSEYVEWKCSNCRCRFPTIWTRVLTCSISAANRTAVKYWRLSRGSNVLIDVPNIGLRNASRLFFISVSHPTVALKACSWASINFWDSAREHGSWFITSSATFWLPDDLAAGDILLDIQVWLNAARLQQIQLMPPYLVEVLPTFSWLWNLFFTKCWVSCPSKRKYSSLVRSGKE